MTKIGLVLFLLGLFNILKQRFVNTKDQLHFSNHCSTIALSLAYSSTTSHNPFKLLSTSLGLHLANTK